jgi:predicted lipoprotein
MQAQMKKYISISIISLLAIFALYNSIYFEKLDVKKERESIKDFNPKEKAEYFWQNKLDAILDSAIDLKLFDTQLANNPESLIRQHGKSVGITSTYSFLVKGSTSQVQPDLDEIPVEIPDGHVKYSLQTKYIFGNAARDATGYFNIDDFENTMDFNSISTELNKLILKREIAKINSLSLVETIKFFGAIEINSENIPRQINIVPLRIEAAR